MKISKERIKQLIRENLEISEEKKHNKKYYISNSNIQGKGAFASKDLKKGETIGLLHTIHKLHTDYTFTELGRSYNHSYNPNCKNVRIGNKRYLVAIEDIEKDEELTGDYTRQKDLEQPTKSFR
jgi:SET domain-containing protein